MINLYMKDHAAYSRYGVNARERVIDNFNWDVVLEDLFTEKSKMQETEIQQKMAV